MKKRTAFFIFFSFFFTALIHAQKSSIVKGNVSDEDGEPVYQAIISVSDFNNKTSTDAQGYYTIVVPSDTSIEIRIEHFGKIPQTLQVNLKPGEVREWNVSMPLVELVIDSVQIEIKRKETEAQRREASLYYINPKLPKALPSAFNDFNKILATLPGVTTNSELSSQYNVRGGNFDENLIYVNDIEIYRPFLVKSGQQEGLSFINPDLVKSIEFSSGGWQPRYGDKLSSVLAVNYKTPYGFRTSGSASLLGATFHVENKTRNERVSYIIGLRQKSSQYLLNTLPVKGEYKPRFFDIQSYVNINLGKDYKEDAKTTLGILATISRNRYFILPTSSTTNFGTQGSALQLEIDFDGKETMEYLTMQSGIKLSRKHSAKLKTDWILSAVRSSEREYSDLEGAYRLSELDTDVNSSQFNKPLFTIGAGSLYDYERSKLNVGVWTLSHKGYLDINKRNRIQWGISESYESIQDQLMEYSFIDSAGYVTINKYLQSTANLKSFRTQAYLQQTIQLDSVHTITYGGRLNYWTLNHQLLVSPRIQYSWKPKGKRDVVYKLAAGVYQQPPFYRELRNMEGVVNKDLKTQTSVHLIAGRDLDFKMYGRDFKFITEVYGKYLYNVVPYDVDNVRIRYYGVNNAKAYAAGADFKLSGEFIKNAESWFSLGVLTTREDVKGDSLGFIRRPTDQRVTAAIFFQDNLPGNPSIKANVNFVFGTGLPFGPPYNAEYRNALNAPAYRRVDVGFSKLITYDDHSNRRLKFLESLWISLEVLNLFGVNNTISYLWIADVNNNRYAVPNTLSARFINLRLVFNK